MLYLGGLSPTLTIIVSCDAVVGERMGGPDGVLRARWCNAVVDDQAPKKQGRQWRPYWHYLDLTITCGKWLAGIDSQLLRTCMSRVCCQVL